ncbi:MAG: FxsA family protein [Rhodospirillaceae bacterium]|nr:FxsA family protein [Rhodospirillaceae bacterium]
MPLLLLLVFIGIPVLEIAGFVVVGRQIGLWPTLGLVVATALAGTVLLRQQGLATLRRAEAALARGEPPAGPLFDAACLLVGAVMLLTPGFFTDALGLCLMIPRLRTWLGRAMWTALSRRGHVTIWQGGAGPRGSGPGGPVIDGAYRPVDEDPGDEPDDSVPPVAESRWRPTRRP